MKRCRPSQNTNVANAMRTPGTPKATAGPYRTSRKGMRSDAEALPRFTIQ